MQRLAALGTALTVTRLLVLDVWHYVFPRFTLSNVPSMAGKVAVVTGPTLNGMGHMSARELARAGAHALS